MHLAILSLSYAFLYNLSCSVFSSETERVVLGNNGIWL